MTNAKLIELLQNADPDAEVFRVHKDWVVKRIDIDDKEVIIS